MAEKMFVEEEHPGLRNLWNGEMWFPFYIAAEVIDCQLDVSRGVAERTLRELCAKGDIRSIRYDDDQEDLVVAADRDDLAEEEPEFIRPSEWLGKELDLEAKYPHVVAVSQDDVLYWIDKQPNKRQQRRRNVTLAEFSALMKDRQRKPEEQDQPIKERVSRKRALVDKAINALWEGRVPDSVSNPVLVQRVGNWLTDYCKQENAPKPEISGDTILRAAGRK
jgi:hypothetical protein